MKTNPIRARLSFQCHTLSPVSSENLTHDGCYWGIAGPQQKVQMA